MSEEDAPVVARLRQAGAVLVGKTGLHALAYGNDSINVFYGFVQMKSVCRPRRVADGAGSIRLKASF
ncbi:hypothetical protein BH24PSE2_BH24PSE2_15950 [soil metagenome]